MLLKILVFLVLACDLSGSGSRERRQSPLRATTRFLLIHLRLRKKRFRFLQNLWVWDIPNEMY